MSDREAQFRDNYDMGERENVIRRLLKRKKKKSKKASDETMDTHVLPRAPVDESKDLGGGYIERLRKLTKQAQVESDIVDPDAGKHRINTLFLNIDIENAMRRANISSNSFAEDLLEADLRPEWTDEIRRCLDAYKANPEAATQAGIKYYEDFMKKRDESMNRLTSSITNLRKVLAQHHDDLGDSNLFKEPSEEEKNRVSDRQKGAEHAKTMDWQIPKHQQAYERGLIDTFTLIDRVVTIFGPQIIAVQSKIPTVKSLDPETVSKAHEHIALEKAELATLLSNFEKALLPAAQAIVKRHGG